MQALVERIRREGRDLLTPLGVPIISLVVIDHMEDQAIGVRSGAESIPASSVHS